MKLYCADHSSVSGNEKLVSRAVVEIFFFDISDSLIWAIKWYLVYSYVL